MERVLALGQDMALLWIRYAPLYLSGVVNTLLLAVAATVLGCLIGLACGLLNTIPIHPQDRLPRRVLLRLLRAVIRIYVAPTWPSRSAAASSPLTPARPRGPRLSA